MKVHGLTYTPHCCRHTFISLMVHSGVNITIIKQIVGHKRVMTITESVYTHFTNNDFIDEVNKIEYPNCRNYNKLLIRLPLIKVVIDNK